MRVFKLDKAAKNEVIKNMSSFLNHRYFLKDSCAIRSVMQAFLEGK